MTVDLKVGGHITREEGMCAMEFCAWIAGEEHTDRPESVDPVLSGNFRAVNDSLKDEDRSLLKPLLVRAIGTANDGQSEARQERFERDYEALKPMAYKYASTQVFQSSPDYEKYREITLRGLEDALDPGGIHDVDVSLLERQEQIEREEIPA